MEGTWCYGSPADKMTVIYPNGDMYFGFLVNNKRHGQGFLSFSDGSKYQGNFEEGKITGYGVWTDKGNH